MTEMISHMQAEGSPEGRSSNDTSRPWTAIRPSTSTSTPNYNQPSAGAIQELRGQIEQMHREMREMREELNRAKPASGSSSRGTNHGR